MPLQHGILVEYADIWETQTYRGYKDWYDYGAYNDYERGDAVAFYEFMQDPVNGHRFVLLDNDAVEEIFKRHNAEAKENDR